MKDIIRRVLKENVDTILYDKVIKVMRRPYIDFLRKNGLGDEKSVKEIMRRKFGDGHMLYLPKKDDSVGIEYRFNWSHRDKGFYSEEHKYTTEDKVQWVHMEKEKELNQGWWGDDDLIIIRKFISSDGDKQYFELTDDLSDIKHEYYVDDGTWDNAPIEVKNDIFFSNNY